MKKQFIVIFLIICCSIMAVNPTFADSNVPSTPSVTMSTTRLFGQSMYETAKAISEQYNQGKVQNVILTTGNGFADALSASVLAHQKDAPILLVDSSVDGSKDAYDYITQHLDPTGTVYIIGGTGIINKEFETKLNNLGYNNLVRIAGYDRYNTSYQLALSLNNTSVSTVVIASGESYPDALSIASFAANKGWPILLTPQKALPEEMKKYLSEKKPSKVYITGGTGVIADDVKSEVIALLPQANVERLAGKDRFDTNATIAQTFSPNPSTIYLATGYGFADALVGSTLAAKNGDPIIFIDPSIPTLPNEVANYFEKLKVGGLSPNIVIFGSREFVSDEIFKSASALILGTTKDGGFYYYSSDDDIFASLEKLDAAMNAKNNVVSSYFHPWSRTINSYLLNNNDQTISVIQAQANNVVTVETYDEQYKLVAKKSIEYELPLFGAFCSGAKYNYIAFGQKNREEDNNKEVIRIVRYDKSFKRIDSVSIKGGESYTVVPFDAGSGKMAENGNELVFHTSRTRYTTDDGLNHQSQLTVSVNTSTMTVTNNLGSFQSNHVSHSFDQYVVFDGDDHVLIDHGDGYPRAIVLHKYTGEDYSEAELFKIPGEIGLNKTGVSVGGFETSSANYIVALNTIDQSLVPTTSDSSDSEVERRDIMLCTLPRNFKQTTSVKQITLAKYVGSDKIASVPQLVKLSDEKLIVMWQEYNDSKPAGKPVRGALKYVLVDKNGNDTSGIQTINNFALSQCKPIIVKDKVVWYANENGIRYFYSIPLN